MHPSARLDIPSYLSVMPLFQEMTPAELDTLAAGCVLSTLARGDMVFRVGQPCNEFHVVIRGQVKLYAIAANGNEKVIELIGANSSFAEALMFTERPYIVNAQALTETLLLTVRKAAVVSEIERDPRFSMRMLAGISRRLHGLIHDVEAYALHSGVQRVIGYLLNDCPENDEHHTCCETATVSLPVTKATLASRLSLTPEYFSRVLNELEQAGLIAREGRDIRILDRRRLAAYEG